MDILLIVNITRRMDRYSMVLLISGLVGTADTVTTMIWLNERPLLPGFHFKGTVNFSSAVREVILPTVIELTGFVSNAKVWFPQKDMPIPISECEGEWSGPLEVPR